MLAPTRSILFDSKLVLSAVLALSSSLTGSIVAPQDAPKPPPTPTSSPTSSPQANPAIEPALEDGCELIVVKKGTNDPVPGTVVSFLDLSDSAEQDGFARADESDTIALFASQGRRFLTDDHGRTRVPFPLKRAAVRAATGDLVGARTIDMWMSGDPLPLRLDMEIDLVQRVRAVDAGGQPLAGMPVAITVKSHGDDRTVFTSAITNADGIAELRHMQRIFGPDPYFKEARVAFDFCGAPQTNTGVALAKLVEEPVQVVRPDCGSLRVRVKGPSGTKLSGPIGVDLSLAQGNGKQPVVSDYRRLALNAQGTGEAFFPMVGLRTRLNVQATPGMRAGYDGTTSVVYKTVDGPTRVGQEVVVELTFATFEPLGPNVSRGLPPPTEGTILVTGTVFDPDGRPAAHQYVEYVELEPPSKTPFGVSEARWVPCRLVLPTWTDRDGKFDLRLLHHDEYESNSDREYEAVRSHGPHPVDWRVSVKREGCVSPVPISFARGARLEIHLVREALVIGRVRMDADVSPADTQIQLVYEEPTDQTKWLAAPLGGRGLDRAIPGLGGHFMWNGLAAGKVTVRILSTSTQRPLVEITGVEVQAGQVVRDPRLQNIDLRGKVPKAQ